VGFAVDAKDAEKVAANDAASHQSVCNGMCHGYDGTPGRPMTPEQESKLQLASAIVTAPIGGPEINAGKEGIIVTGALIERTFMTSKGAVDFMAEAVVDGKKLILKDSVLYGRTEEALTGMTKEIYRGFETMKSWAASHGFESLEISGTRAANSSSATPGSAWSKAWDLTK
jgi:hypothetical protein